MQKQLISLARFVTPFGKTDIPDRLTCVIEPGHDGHGCTERGVSVVGVPG